MELCSYCVKLQHNSHYSDLNTKYDNDSLPINKKRAVPKNFWDGLISSKKRIIYVRNLLHQGIPQLLDKS